MTHVKNNLKANELPKIELFYKKTPFPQKYHQRSFHTRISFHNKKKTHSVSLDDINIFDDGVSKYLFSLKNDVKPPKILFVANTFFENRLIGDVLANLFVEKANFGDPY